MLSLKILNFYIIIFTATLLSASSKKAIRILSFFFLTIIAGIRYNSGRDYMNYYQIYLENASGSTRFLNNEFGFYYLMKILNNLGVSYNSLLMLIAIFLLFTIYICFFRNYSKIYMGIFIFLVIEKLYFNIIAGSAIRQGIAIGFFILAVENYLNRKIIKYLIFCYIAILFHRSAIIGVFIPAIFLISKAFFKYIPLIATSLVIFHRYFIMILIFILNILNLDEYSKAYLQVESSSDKMSIIKIIYYMLFIFQYYFLYYNFSKLEGRRIKKYAKLLLIGMIINFLLISNIGIFHRILPYFQIYYIPILLSFKYNRKVKKIYFIIFFLFLFIGNHLKQVMSKTELSKYYIYYQTFFGKDLKKDLERWRLEEERIN
ncbi:EpsG family protein [Cetobacterium sp. 2G large]|uniref:EpsG family protein n=1 Tax=Cetobacterium sp. 2G large TaxID=2759680 RepID=UPI00163BB6C6|nr:EpsG family protein [Cetobacterium sp. 2G large]